jgi:hypothetical protein
LGSIAAKILLHVIKTTYLQYISTSPSAVTGHFTITTDNGNGHHCAIVIIIIIVSVIIIIIIIIICSIIHLMKAATINPP